MELLEYFFGIAQFVPHGMCLLWRPDLLLMHGGADLLIAVAYFTIPVVIVKATRTRPDLLNTKVAWMFASFITACALTHLSALITLWLPYYGIQGVVKLATAGVSIYTAIQCVRLLPEFLQIPSHQKLAMAIAQQDVQRALSEEMSAQNKELDQFAYIASHDLKEPLRGVSINANFLLLENPPEATQKRLNRIMTLCAKMEALIGELLALSRLSVAEKWQDKVDMVELGEEVKDSMSEALTEKGAVIDIDPDLPTIQADKPKIRTILGNLFTNALKYNRSDTPKITLGYTPQMELDGETWNGVFFVRDNGIGIEPKHTEKVFNLFSRLNPERVFGPGTGAGLYFVARIVQNYGGQIKVQSVPGEGSTFYFTIPQEK